MSECHSNVVLCTEMKQGAGDGYVARSLWTYYTIPRTGSRVWKQQSDLWDAPIGFHNTSYLFSIWYHSYRPLNGDGVLFVVIITWNIVLLSANDVNSSVI